ncbi:MAG: UDP-N-acetylmuramoyl-L-alanyl-D-glutamate--2,6-diaminopimelate ligase, partial [Magnetococcales bacterium]|nr:UDP-N-acetylmuramoyl-L-alanyl-D-glutamate--2,6-diaminopimelate ligase [Magnetococcales bacterium]
HALDQERVHGLPWHVAAFLNLTRDHLDYHGDEEHYFAAKARLFLDHTPERAVINLDDPWGRRLVEEIGSRYPIIGFSTRQEQIQGTTELLTATDCRHTWSGSFLTLRVEGDAHPVRLQVPGDFNVANALAAAAIARGVGTSIEEIVTGLERFTAVRGRLQPIRCGHPFAVAVDYAHTPDALERLLILARGITKGRVIVLFGCGGDRDHGKRPQMGALAARYADHAVVTDDNPRTESPAEIRRQIINGYKEAAEAEISTSLSEIGDRAEAIATAIEMAQPGDAVLLAGKGHETVQIGADGTTPFDDAAVARSALATLGYHCQDDD